MARIRVRFEFNRGRVGAPLDRLGEIAEQTERFLRSLAADLRLDVKKGEWLATNFANGSVSFDTELARDTSESAAHLYVESLDSIVSNGFHTDPDSPASYATLLEFSKIADHIEPSDSFYVGLYNGRADEPKQWREVSYRSAHTLRETVNSPIRSYGSVQGTVHAWYRGAKPPFIQVRELSTGALVKCFYRPEHYDRIHSATQTPETVVHVSGYMDWNKAIDTINELKADSIEFVKPLSDDEFERVFGIAPGMTGGLSTDDYMDRVRGDGE